MPEEEGTASGGSSFKFSLALCTSHGVAEAVIFVFGFGALSGGVTLKYISHTPGCK
jgi:hypothetical protein